MLVANAVVDTDQPRLQVGENQMDDRQRGVFHSIVNLQTAINRFIAETNDDPTPFVWTANPNKIVAAVKRGHQALDSIH